MHGYDGNMNEPPIDRFDPVQCLQRRTPLDYQLKYMIDVPEAHF